MPLRSCFREPIPELLDAAARLDRAVNAHRAGNTEEAGELIRSTNTEAIRAWTESLWGKKSPHVRPEAGPAPTRDESLELVKVRMPTTAEKRALIERDGYHCRFCGLPLIRREIRQRIAKVYPAVLPWGSRNVDQHAAFQAMWLQYDHVLPHAHGGDNGLDNSSSPVRRATLAA